MACFAESWLIVSAIKRRQTAFVAVVVLYYPLVGDMTSTFSHTPSTVNKSSVHPADFGGVVLSLMIAARYIQIYTVVFTYGVQISFFLPRC